MIKRRVLIEVEYDSSNLYRNDLLFDIHQITGVIAVRKQKSC